MSDISINEYVSFCNEYQRQMSEIIKTYSLMNQRVYSLLNIQNNLRQTNVSETNTTQTNVSETTERTDNINVSTQNSNRRTQPRINISSHLLYPQTTTTPRNITTHTMFTTLNNQSVNDITSILGYSPDNLNSNFSDIFGNLFTTLLNQPSQNMDAVVVTPTTQQIENATEIICYGNIENPSHDCCPIGLTHFNNEDQVIRIKYCGHYFNKNNLQSWFNNSVRCPLCRYDIREYEVDVHTTTQNNNIDGIDLEVE